LADRRSVRPPQIHRGGLNLLAIGASRSPVPQHVPYAENENGPALRANSAGPFVAGDVDPVALAKRKTSGPVWEEPEVCAAG
jgi:hypothetical protein